MFFKKSNLCLIVSFALILGVFSDYLFHQKSVGVSFFVFISLVIILILILVVKSKKRISKTQSLILILAILLSAFIFLRSSSFLSFFNFYGSIYLLFLFLVLFFNRNILNFSFTKYISLPTSFFVRSFREAGSFVKKCKLMIPESNKVGSKEFRSVIKGTIIAIPFLIIFALLLSSADQVFQSYLNKFFKFDLDFEIVLRVLKVSIISYLFLGIFYRITKGSDQSSESTLDQSSELVLDKKAEEVKGLDHRTEVTSEENESSSFIESATVLVLIEALFLLFIVIQFFYLFGGKDYVWGLNEYITYSEYAKKGFHELIYVSILSFILIYAIDVFGKRKTLKEKKIFKILGTVLILEISVIIYSAWTRMAVYVDGYGLTFSRFFVFVFLLWIFLVFLNFLYKILSEKRKEFFFLSIFCFSAIFWIGINVINPDAFIARKNVQRLIQLGSIDHYYLSRLSVDSIPETMKIFQTNVDEKIKMEVAEGLYFRCAFLFGGRYYFMGPSWEEEPISFGEKLENIRERQNENWQSLNISERKALLALEENYQEIVKYQSKYFKKQADECWEMMKDCNGKWGCEKEMCEMYEKKAKLEE
ncbi:MAG: DUF4173 domain-containing protein [Candidatus Pacebacteria bacterium]|nr:DUF4173 domain-containing protein [Candidatus Paceibacterota bacterium]